MFRLENSRYKVRTEYHVSTFLYLGLMGIFMSCAIGKKTLPMF